MCDIKTTGEKKIWIKAAREQDFRTVCVGDWIEGMGVIANIQERNFIRHFGYMLMKKGCK